MKAIRFWLDYAKRCLEAWDDLSTTMNYNPFKAKPKKGVDS